MKKILIVTAYYPPCERIGAKRPYNLANYLVKNDWDVTVLTMKEHYTLPTGVKKVGDDRVNIIRTKAFLPYVSLMNKNFKSNANKKTTPEKNASHDSLLTSKKTRVVNKAKDIVRASLNFIDRIDEYSGWYRCAMKEMRKRDIEFDVVLATIPPYSTCYLGMKLSQHYKCKFIMDYRDPWNDMEVAAHLKSKYGKKKLAVHKKIEAKCLNEADFVVTVSPGISSMLIKHCDSKVLTLPQGYAEKLEIVPDKCRIDNYLLYAGSLAYGRNLSTILAALKALHVNNNISIKLFYCGVHSNIAQQQAKSVNAEDYLEIKGYVRESEAFKLAKKSICNLIIISAGYEYAYPGKLFDLISSNRPICVLGEKENEAGKLVEKYNLGINVVALEIDDVVKSLLSIINREHQLPSNIAELSSETIFTKLLNELNKWR